MANSAWSEKILQLLRRMNNFYSPGSCRASCYRFEIDKTQVGWIPPHVASLLTRYPEVFSPPHDGALSLCPSLDSYGKRSEAVDAVLQAVRQEGSLTCLKGWRDEKYSVMPKFSDPPLMCMERAATSLFGVRQNGVHLNGYTVSDSGEVSMWLARRSPTKQTYPGLLDNVAAGGLAAGVSIKQTLVKECQEEACIPAAIAGKARPVTTIRGWECAKKCSNAPAKAVKKMTAVRQNIDVKISKGHLLSFCLREARPVSRRSSFMSLCSHPTNYTYEDEEGVSAESQFVFDLELPLDFKPRAGDNEVQDFYLLPIDKVKELLATDDFKPNSAMVVLDFLIRHSFIEPDIEPCYQEFVEGLHQTLE